MKNNLFAVHAAIQYIETHLDEKLQIAEVAESLHYSKYHLHRQFSQVLGITMHSYIQRRKLTEAARMLTETDYSLAWIAQQGGYETQQAFSTVFKMMYKQSPQQYRNSCRYYPLQMPLVLTAGGEMGQTDQREAEAVLAVARKADIAAWMELIPQVVDGFPHLEEDSYRQVLQSYIKQERALLMRTGKRVVGAVMVDYESGSIDFFGVHPVWRRRGIGRQLMSKVVQEVLQTPSIYITTYREGDKADPGYRRELLDMGFQQEELLMEFGYPTQRFIRMK